MYGPKWPFLLNYGSRDTRRIDFSRVDGLSTDTLVLERHRFYPLFLKMIILNKEKQILSLKGIILNKEKRILFLK